MSSFRTVIALFVLVAVATLGRGRDARACAVAPPAAAHVAVAEESAIIVWNDTTKVEHFIRRASFRSDKKEFGFLVPTPTKPELAEANDDSFRQLEEIIKPEVVFHDEWSIEPTLFLLFFSRSMTNATPSSAVAPAVRVLESKRVGDYDAAVLEADDAGALAEWLRTHGYAQRGALDEWLAPYVAKKWKLTAFKIADDAADPPPDGIPGGGAQSTPRAFGTRAIRMSFKTERPFFPYREPRDQRESVPPSLSGPRSLRILYLGPARVDAWIGEGTTMFPGRTTWSGPFDATKATLPVAVPKDAWLTAIEDDASPRPGVDELWLLHARDPSPIKPPPIPAANHKRIPIPMELVAAALVVGVVIVKRRKRRKRTEKPDL